MKNTSTGPSSARKGMAITVALVFITAMGILTSLLYMNLANRMKLLRQHERSLSALNLAEAAIEKGLSELVQNPEAYIGEQEIPLGEGTFGISCERESLTSHQFVLTGKGSIADTAGNRLPRSVRVVVRLEESVAEGKALWNPVIISWCDLQSK